MPTITCPDCKKPNKSTSQYCAYCGETLHGGLSQTNPLSTDPPTLKSDTILQDRYRIVAELGRGGFGAVYKAWDINLNRICAIKENLDTTEEARRQFTREAMVLAGLSHPNLPRVTDHFIIAGQGQYLVMDFIEGDDLESLVERQGPITPDQAITWISQIADALGYLHTHKPPIVHRDVKPANIRLTPQGSVFLVDFGLVKQYHPHQRTTLGARAVTPGYSPPEQYGTGITDERSDIYALAATLYSLLTGTDPMESVQRVGKDTLVPVQKINSQVKPYVGQAIQRSMSLQPDQRYQSVSDFNAALTIHVPPTVVQPTAQKPQTRPIWPIVGALVILALCLISVGLFLPKYGPSLVGMIFPSTTPSPTTLFATPTQPNTITPTATMEITQVIETTEGAFDNTTLTPTQFPTSTSTPSPYPSNTPTQPPSPTPPPTPTAPPTGVYDLAFASDRSGQISIYLMDTDNRSDWTALPLPSGYNRAWWPWFCQSRIAIEAQDRGGSNPQWIFIIEPGSGSTTRLKPSVRPQALAVPRCSPDGSTIAYTIKQDGKWGQLVVDSFPADQSGPILQEPSWGYASWPLGGMYYYSMNRENDQWVINRTNDFLSGAGNRTHIVSDGKYPAISPDGKNLVYVCHATADLCIQHLTSGETRTLIDLAYVKVNDEKFPASAVWSSDGEWIYFSSEDGGDWDIFRIRPDSSGLQNMTADWESNELMPALQW